eukprot:gb/GECG01011644.1/.p1 GENE.gb/GECG01011644.1/~~gb/GECG01011644.1/.p1  ORF type:complete len:121 (+),score=4.18 gb/GECG01011644.1/:1-363(+)
MRTDNINFDRVTNKHVSICGTDVSFFEYIHRICHLILRLLIGAILVRQLQASTGNEVTQQERVHVPSRMKSLTKLSRSGIMCCVPAPWTVHSTRSKLPTASYVYTAPLPFSSIPPITLKV